MASDEGRDSRISNGASTSRSLLAGARLADPAAWQRLVRLYAPLVASWCHRWGVAQQDIGDILQDVFSAVASHLERFHKDRPSDTFRGWLFVITRNKVRDYFRRRSTELAAAGGSEAMQRLQQVREPDEFSEPPDADDALVDSLMMRALAAIRTEFHERTWQAFWEVVVQGHSAVDAAVLLGMTPGAVRVAKSRVLLRLRRELGDIAD